MNFETRPFAILVSALLLTLSPLAGAVCNGADIAADAPDSRFEVNGETVTDTATGLMWKRCSEGLSGPGCTGTAETASWSDALAKAVIVNAQPAVAGAGFSDWRLPNRNELASLVERKCVNPAINATIFPGTPVAQGYWTSSPFALDGSRAWFVDFNAGDIGALPKSGSKNVRLVRGGY